MEKVNRLVCGDNIYTATAFIEEHAAIGKSEDGVIFANANIKTGSPACAALTNDDVTSNDSLAAEFFDTEAFAA